VSFGSTVVRSSLTVVALLLLLALGACAQPAPPPPNAAQPPAAELARFYGQELSFGPCAGYATTGADEKLFASDPRFECARLEVPLDYDNPAGETAQVAVLRVPARGASMGSLLLNSGGPGGTGMNFAAIVARTLAQSPVTERFDLIGFDPRGVGATTPAVDCFTDEQLRSGKAPQNEFLISAGTLSEDGARQLVQTCAQLSGGEQALAAVATRDTVRDMDVLRAALGEQQLNFFGQSYGTRVGAFYAAEYPQHVRAMVLDGAVDPRLGLVERRLSQFAGFQRSFEQMAADCATRPDCPLGPDPARATQVFQDIVRPLLDRPMPAEGGLTYNDAVGAVISGLYYSEAWPMIIQGLAELRDGRPDTLARLLQLFSGPDDGGRLSNFAEAAYAIGCMDEDRLTVEQARDVRGRIYQVAPFADPGRGVEGARDGCEAWPAPPKPTYPFPDRVEGVPPTLTVSITGDPTTPYDAGIRLAEALRGSLLTVEGEQHTVVAAGKNACVADLVADYLVNLRTPPAGARCTL
jgi:pimeloyl-ACP methyl ester carboxylesterase